MRASTPTSASALIRVDHVANRLRVAVRFLQIDAANVPSESVI